MVALACEGSTYETRRSFLVSVRVLGISALTHDAAVAVVEHDRILFAGHSERYTRRKNERHLCQPLLDEALRCGRPDVIAWNGLPRRQLYREVFSGEQLPSIAARLRGTTRSPSPRPAQAARRQPRSRSTTRPTSSISASIAASCPSVARRRSASASGRRRGGR